MKTYILDLLRKGAKMFFYSLWLFMVWVGICVLLKFVIDLSPDENTPRQYIMVIAFVAVVFTELADLRMNKKNKSE